MVSPRIYYRETKLKGPPLETKIITLETFDYIQKYAFYNTLMKDMLLDTYEMDKISKLVLEDGEFKSVYIDTFNRCTIRKDGISYEATEGNFYLPEAIIMYDAVDSGPFVLEYYFIAKVNNQLELCFCKKDADVKWHQSPDYCTATNDPATIKKVEDTLVLLKDRIAYDWEQWERERMEKEVKASYRKPLSVKKKAAYVRLTELCMPDSPKKKEVLEFIKNLKEYDNGEEYATTYDEFRMYLNENLIPFIITLDWSEAIGEFESWVRDAVEENFKKTFKFDRGNRFNDDSSVSDKDVFYEFDRQLAKVGLKISMIETNGDEYQLVIHPCSATDEIVKSMAVLDKKLSHK